MGVLMMHTHTIASISSAVRQTPGWAEIKTLFTFPLENSKIFMQEIKRNCFSFSNLKACYYFFKYYLFLAFCLYLIAIVETDRKAERGGRRRSKGPQVGFEPGPLASGHMVACSPTELKSYRY